MRNTRYDLCPVYPHDPFAVRGFGVGASAWDYGPPVPEMVGPPAPEMMGPPAPEMVGPPLPEDFVYQAPPPTKMSNLALMLGGAAGIAAGAAMRHYIGGWFFGPLGWIWIGFGALSAANGLVNAAQRLGE